MYLIPIIYLLTCRSDTVAYIPTDRDKPIVFITLCLHRRHACGKISSWVGEIWMSWYELLTGHWRSKDGANFNLLSETCRFISMVSLCPRYNNKKNPVKPCVNHCMGSITQPLFCCAIQCMSQWECRISTTADLSGIRHRESGTYSGRALIISVVDGYIRRQLFELYQMVCITIPSCLFPQIIRS